MGYRLTAKAAQDIGKIYLNGVRQFGPRQADEYHALLERSFRFLARNPLAARERPEFSPPVRIHPVQSHIVIYRVEVDGDVLVIRVRHGHEDWTT